MLTPQLRLRHLRCFLETARLGSLSAAAEALHVSQPAASKTIRDLEEILGVALFDRGGRRLVLTRGGQAFLAHAGAAMAELERAQRAALDPPETRERIAVGLLPTAASELFPRAAMAFREERPDCLIRVFTGPNWLLLSQLRERALDLVVGRMPPAGQSEGLIFRQLYWERILPVVRPGHPLLRPDWRYADLARYPLMLPPSGAMIAAPVRSWLHSVGIAEPAPDYENVSLAFGRRVVMASDTVWFISEGVVRLEMDAGTLAPLPVENQLLGGPVGVSLRADAAPSSGLEGLIAALAAVTP
ncbi:LysR substrate-binding domain-containing protein [Acidimangrovimonas sediminis]|uniref:LysR substrate-binding domain-containing protein n=1 Tax=Acidimangrovimonas sediminis TaxID=2056283 RepID=UPI000C7F7992|nr:LysR substrate-binding domain-containing protein [Acidimangrovimonas sediminis]